MKNQIEIASEVNNSSSVSTEAHETRKNKWQVRKLVFAVIVVIATFMSCKVNDDDYITAHVRIDKYEIELAVGETATITPTVIPQDATNKEVTWKSSAPTIATVEDGVVTAIAVGKATITVTTVDGNSDLCYVTVKNID